jgi:hypothetical protein
MKLFLAGAAIVTMIGPLAAAAAGVNATLGASVAGSYAGSNPLGSVVFQASQSALLQLAPGTASGQGDLLFSDRRSLAASASENLDLAGVLKDPLGTTLTFGHVKWIYIKAAAANTNDVCVGGAGSNTFVGPFADASDIVCVKPGGVALLAVAAGVGWVVTPSTGDLLEVANSAGTTGVTYDVIIAGTST